MSRTRYPMIAALLLSSLATTGCFPFFLFGGPHSVYEFSSMKRLVDATLDMKDSPPDLVVSAPKKEMLRIVRGLGADKDFDGKKHFLKNA